MILNPPGTVVALTDCTWTCGLLNSVSVAMPPNGTSGATTSPPFCAATVASTVAVNPRKLAVPRSVSWPFLGCDRLDVVEEEDRRSEIRLGDGRGARELAAPLAQRAVPQRQRPHLELLRRGIDRARVAGSGERAPEVTDPRAVAAHPYDDAVRLMP